MCLYFIISHTSVMVLNDFHINCLKKSQNNTCVCDALRPIVYICSPCVAINSTGESQPSTYSLNEVKHRTRFVLLTCLYMFA